MDPPIIQIPRTGSRDESQARRTRCSRDRRSCEKDPVRFARVAEEHYEAKVEQRHSPQSSPLITHVPIYTARGYINVYTYTYISRG